MNTSSNNYEKLRILVYHKVLDKENFENQITFLKSKFYIINILELYGILNNGNLLPENPLLITFDDGDESVYENAFPILKKYEIPAIIFVITDLIDTDKPFWWNEIEYYLGEDEGKKKVWEVKKWSNEKREEYLVELRRTKEKPRFKKMQLNALQLREMQTAGITIANHSHTHPMFNQCTEEELQRELIESSSKLIELGFDPNVFAYPNGNCSEIAEQKLKEFGIKFAFLFDHKINKGVINPLRISRLMVNDSTPLWKFKFILSGWHSKIVPVTKALAKLRK